MHNAALAHGGYGERRDVDGRSANAHILQGQGMAACPGSDVKHMAPGLAQRQLFEGRHFIESAEKVGHGNLVLIEVGREYAQSCGFAIPEIVGNGTAHGVGGWFHVYIVKDMCIPNGISAKKLYNLRTFQESAVHFLDVRRGYSPLFHYLCIS